MTRFGAHSFWEPGSIIRSDYGQILIDTTVLHCMGTLSFAHACTLPVLRYYLAHHVHLSAFEIQEKDCTQKSGTLFS